MHLLLDPALQWFQLPSTLLNFILWMELEIDATLTGRLWQAGWQAGRLRSIAA